MKNSFKELKLEELVAKRDELRKKYFEVRFQAVVGHVENPLEKRNLRRQIARLETRIHARELAGEDAAAASGKLAAAAKAAAATRRPAKARGAK